MRKKTRKRRERRIEDEDIIESIKGKSENADFKLHLPIVSVCLW